MTIIFENSSAISTLEPSTALERTVPAPLAPGLVMRARERVRGVSQAEAEAKAAGGDKSAEDDVVDADFEEVKGDKKSA